MSDPSKALLSPQQSEILAQARAMNAPRAIVRPPEIKLYNTMMKVDLSNPGDFFTKRYIADQDKTEIQNIGPTVDFVILHMASTYSYYSEKLERLVAWTSDIVDYSKPAYLFKNDGEHVFIEKQGTGFDVKDYIKAKYVNRDPDTGEVTKSLMTYSTVLYVLHGGTGPENIYRMFVSNAGMAGLEPTTGKPDFKHPQPGSLKEVLKPIQFAGSALFERKIRMHSTYVDGARQFWLMQFADAGEIENLPEVVETYNTFRFQWLAMQKADVERASGPEEAAAAPATVPYEPSIKVEDLPF